MAEQNDSGRVETRAVIHASHGDINVRRNDTEGIWIGPQDGLDGDGEIHVVIADLGQALRVLGFNRADLFPDG